MTAPVLSTPLRDRLRIIRMPRIEVEHVPVVAAGIVKDMTAERDLDTRRSSASRATKRLLGVKVRGGVRANVEQLLAARQTGATRR
jgi:hypothetical protein